MRRGQDAGGCRGLVEPVVSRPGRAATAASCGADGDVGYRWPRPAPGHVVAEAMFVNREEIPVYPVYRDPVHDFGFFRYDPKAIKFLKYEEIPLAPEAACVGLEIRVVGNDSGEKGDI
ncbi:uncharacterized protein A4U43_C04F32800 [Asparagus officinalis]|uniref:Uncharacterized protein n=1 Tax=Asparagus officinalis TaxID=4686 RepID=A0A5P1FA86_ASPOF|nr:uncharacterized protein A4U43_C04F32800 [Asparagus officinalis]